MFRSFVLISIVLCFSEGMLRGQTKSAFEIEMEELARRIAEKLGEQKIDAVQLSHISFGGRVPSSSGVQIRAMLVKKLTAEGIRVDPSAKAIARGSYRPDREEKNDLVRVAVEIELFTSDKAEKPFAKLAQGVHGDESIPQLLGGTVCLLPDSSRIERNRELIALLDPRNNKLVKTIRTSFKRANGEEIQGEAVEAIGSKFRVEVLIKQPKGLRPIPARITKDGLAYVDLKREDVYVLRLHNDYPFEVAARVGIDGITPFDFWESKEKTNRAPHFFVVKSKETAIVEGWYLSSEKVEEFLVAEYSKSAAVSLKVVDQIGTISVSFAACWEPGASPPSDEPVDPDVRSKSLNGTARGAQLEKKSTVSAREIGIARGTVSVRYNRPE